MEKKLAGVLCFLLFTVFIAEAQPRTLNLDEAVQLGIQNSKQLKRSQYKIDEALSRLAQAKDLRLPDAKVSFQYLHALMMSRLINIPGVTKDPIKLPFDFPAYLGTLSVTEPIFNGNQFKYARQSADLMVQMSRLDADKDKEDIIWLVIDSYMNYDKILENQLITAQNMQDIQNKLDEIVKYEAQGLATKNDVLRYQLQKSQMQLTEIELENNRKVANYNMNVILGLPDSTEIILPKIDYKVNETLVFADLLQQAETNRRELQDLSYETKLADVNVKKLHDQRLPTVAASAGAYYINPTGQVIPTHNNLIAPITLGIGASWDIGTLYKNKNKEKEAALQRQELNTAHDQAVDDIRKDVHEQFMNYQTSLEKIKILQVAVDQATENERITESKFKNNLVNTTDRIDAQTQLYQARVNLELAKSDATISYYDVLKSTGKIHL
ncbi:MAG TPA: TolC family protein [Puia sp.]|jgi:outer membrane protein TolC|nr:TolC family protein [Puia sp.]